MFGPGDGVVVAVSGGPDSLCLLHALVRLRRLLGIHVDCFHFDHGLRADSAADAGYVRRQAALLRVPFILRRATDRPPRSASPEAWARVARYRSLTATLEELGGGVGAVGHTSDDRAETVLLALFRGGGLDAVAGMRAVNRPVVRPLIDVTREETTAFCRSLRLRPRMDPMNEDPAYMRAALRAALPSLERALGRGIRTALARSASLLQEDADLLDELARRAERSVVIMEARGAALRAGELAALPRPIAARVVRRVLLDVDVVPEAAHVEAILGLAARRAGRTITLPGALEARRTGEYVRLSRPSPAGEASVSSVASGRTGTGRGSHGDSAVRRR